MLPRIVQNYSSCQLMTAELPRLLPVREAGSHLKRLKSRQLRRRSSSLHQNTSIKCLKLPHLPTAAWWRHRSRAACHGGDVNGRANGKMSGALRARPRERLLNGRWLSGGNNLGLYRTESRYIQSGSNNYRPDTSLAVRALVARRPDPALIAWSSFAIILSFLKQQKGG